MFCWPKIFTWPLHYCTQGLCCQIVEFLIIYSQRQNLLKLVILCEFLYIEIKTFPENPHFNQYYKIMLICTVIKSEGTIVWHGFELVYSINLMLNWFWVSELSQLINQPPFESTMYSIIKLYALNNNCF